MGRTGAWRAVAVVADAPAQAMTLAGPSRCCRPPVAAEQRAAVGPPRASRRRVAMSNQRVSGGALDAIPSTELMRQVLDEAKTLVRLETRLARDELASDLVQLKYAAIFGAAAAVLALLSLGTIVMAIVLAFGGAALVAVLAA